MNELAIIGRERALIDALTTALHNTVRSRHNYGPIRETSRGSTFAVELLVDGESTDRVARITVELEPMEDRV